MLNRIKIVFYILSAFLCVFSSLSFAITTVSSYKMVTLQSPNSSNINPLDKLFFLAASMEIQDNGTGEVSVSDVLNLDPTMKAYFYPNPFYLETGSALGYELQRDMDIEIRIYNLMGTEIFRQAYIAGTMGGLGHNNHQFYNKIQFNKESFRGVDLSAGVYLFVLINEGKVIQKGKFAVRPGRIN